MIRKKCTVCPRSLDPIYIVNYYIKWATTSWTYNNFNVLQEYNVHSTVIFRQRCFQSQWDVTKRLPWIYEEIIDKRMHSQIKKKCGRGDDSLSEKEFFSVIGPDLKAWLPYCRSVRPSASLPQTPSSSSYQHFPSAQHSS